MSNSCLENVTQKPVSQNSDQDAPTRDVFNAILARVKQTPQWDAMSNTVEDSPWHREANVKTHTEMVLEAYDDHFAGQRTPLQSLIVKLALMFHDFGKPVAEQTITKEDGTTYRRYAGHEVVSANAFMNFILSNKDLYHQLQNVGIDDTRIRAIRLMIEHHLPYEYKPDLINTLKLNLAMMLGDDWYIFGDMLISDCRGRISDDHDTKINKVKDWITDFRLKTTPLEDMLHLNTTEHKTPVVTFMVGVSGSGKSTYTNKMLGVNTNLKIFSLDEIRIRLYKMHNPSTEKMSEKDLYRKAFMWCNTNSELFTKTQNDEFLVLLKSGVDIIVDNMNATRKSRRKYIPLAKQHGYTIRVVELVAPLKTVISRQETRTDKTVPNEVVCNTYFNTQSALYEGMKPTTKGEASMIETVFTFL